jgi:hypothetical protein
MATAVAAALTTPPTSDADAAQDYLRAVAVLDEALDVEGKAVNQAADKLQTLLAPSPTTDGEIETREADAASIMRGQVGLSLHSRVSGWLHGPAVISWCVEHTPY